MFRRLGASTFFQRQEDIFLQVAPTHFTPSFFLFFFFSVLRFLSPCFFPLLSRFFSKKNLAKGSRRAL